MDTVVGSVEREGHGPWELPEGWCWAALGCLAILIRGVSYTKDQSTDQLLPTHRALVRGNNIQNGQISRDELTFVANEAVSETQYLRERDIVLTMSSGSPSLIGKSAWVSGSDLDLTFGAFCGCLRSLRAEDARWVYWYLQAPHYRKVITNLAKGTNINNLKRDHLISLPIPLAPLAEQRRIVARVDALFAEIAEGEAALEAARKGLDTFRRALLKAAVTGELTKDWRANNPVTETGHDLLARIKANRAAKGQARGRGKRSPDARPLDTSTLPELPESWAWERLSALGDFGRGKSRHRPRDDARLYGGSMPFVQTGIVANSDDFIQSYQQTYSAFGVEQSRVWPPGTLCITIAANIAKTAITTFDCCFPDSIVGLTPERQIDPYWVHIWIKTIQQRLERFAPATAQKNINLEVLDGVAVPIPPPTEAAEILRLVSEALAASADTLAMLDAEAADAARLKQSILKAAFEGRLVPQDPADEPASAMLARLKTIPSSAPRARRGRARKSAP